MTHMKKYVAQGKQLMNINSLSSPCPNSNYFSIDSAGACCEIDSQDLIVPPGEAKFEVTVKCTTEKTLRFGIRLAEMCSEIFIKVLFNFLSSNN